ncbi:MAG: WD40 repeat domain-containing protein, partial [Pseudonocardia sp.]
PWTGHTDRVSAVAYSPDGTRVVSTGDDGTLRCWDAATGESEFTIASGPEGSSATWRPDQRLTSVRGEAWRWLRVTTHDAAGGVLSVDPYEWHYPTEGGPAPVDDQPADHGAHHHTGSPIGTGGAQNSRA